MSAGMRRTIESARRASCFAAGALAGGAALFVALAMTSADGVVMRYVPLVAYALLAVSYQFMRRAPRWFAAPLLAAAAIMATVAVWIAVSPEVSKHPGETVWVSAGSAVIALVLALVVYFYPWDLPPATVDGAPAGPAQGRAGTRGARIASLAVLGGLAGLVAALVTIGTHGKVLGLLAFALAVIAIIAAALADGVRTTGYLLLLATGVLGFAFAWYYWIPAGLLLVTAGLLEYRLVREQRAYPREAGEL